LEGIAATADHNTSTICGSSSCCHSFASFCAQMIPSKYGLILPDLKATKIDTKSDSVEILHEPSKRISPEEFSKASHKTLLRKDLQNSASLKSK
jgi:hypothetical protein